MVYVLVCFDKTLIKINLERRRLIWLTHTYHNTSLRKSGGRGGEGRTEGRNLEASLHAIRKMFCLLSYSTQNHLAKRWLTISLDFAHQSPFEKTARRLVHRQIWWRQFLCEASYSQFTSVCDKLKAKSKAQNTQKVQDVQSMLLL
jgi:hypothetical protein